MIAVEIRKLRGDTGELDSIGSAFPKQDAYTDEWQRMFYGTTEDYRWERDWFSAADGPASLPTGYVDYWKRWPSE